MNEAKTNETKSTSPTDAEVVAWLDSNCSRGWGMRPRSGRWGATTTDDRSPFACHVTGCGDTQSEARAMLAQALGMGAAAKPEPPKCPLPKVGGWEWRQTYDGIPNVFEARCETWHILATAPTDEVLFWDWVVYTEGHGRCSGITRTRRGAMCAAERAARRAWEVRNGSHGE